MMPWIKVIAVAMVAALLNPICCCYGDLMFAGDVAPVETSCCAAGGGEDAAKGTDAHDPGNCPHQGGSALKRVSTADSLSIDCAFAKAPDAVVAFAFDELPPVSFPQRDAFASIPPARLAEPLFREFCVLRL